MTQNSTNQFNLVIMTCQDIPTEKQEHLISSIGEGGLPPLPHSWDSHTSHCCGIVLQLIAQVNIDMIGQKHRNL
jgi:hypothetical protein